MTILRFEPCCESVKHRCRLPLERCHRERRWFATRLETRSGTNSAESLRANLIGPAPALKFFFLEAQCTANAGARALALNQPEKRRFVNSSLGILSRVQKWPMSALGGNRTSRHRISIGREWTYQRHQRRFLPRTICCYGEPRGSFTIFVMPRSLRGLSRIDRPRCHIHAGNEGFVAARARQRSLAATGRVIEIERLELVRLRRRDR